MSDLAHAVRVEKKADTGIETVATFIAPRQLLFDAITSPEHLRHWMSAGGMSLVDTQVDARPGGTFRYVYARPSGAKIEVRGVYATFDRPRGFAYLESYDFSPLQIDVAVTLEEMQGGTRLIQTLRYRSARERDEDFEGVAPSSREAYGKLARYLDEVRKHERRPDTDPGGR